jgi:hypothetical protein
MLSVHDREMFIKSKENLRKIYSKFAMFGYDYEQIFRTDFCSVLVHTGQGCNDGLYA